MFNSPLPNMRQATTFYHTELRCVIIQVSSARCSWQSASGAQACRHACTCMHSSWAVTVATLMVAIAIISCNSLMLATSYALGICLTRACLVWCACRWGLGRMVWA
jgi:hypothetical protein